MPENKWTMKRRRWARLLQELDDSGLSATEFAKKRRIEERTLRRWITMAKRGTWVPGDYLEEVAAPVEDAPVEAPTSTQATDPEPSTDPTAPLQLVAAVAADSSAEAVTPATAEGVATILPVTLIGAPSAEVAYELTFGGRQLRLPRDFEVHRVARLVRALEAATC